MARPLRIEYEGAWYHVMNRGAGYQNIFFNDEDKILFLNLLSEINSRYCIEIHSYCLMSNHYHLLLRTPMANLGRAMRHLDGIYTQRFNKRTGTDGPLFRGRYRSILVESDRYLLLLSRYIHLNPVQAKIVSNPEFFIWSSYPAFLNMVPRPLWLYCDEILNQMSKKSKEIIYQQFIDEGIDQETLKFLQEKKRSCIFGSESFIKQITKDYLIKKPIDREISELKKLCRAQIITITDVVQVVANYFAISEQEVFKCTNVKNKMFKKIAIYLAVARTQAKLVEVGLAFGLSYTSISKIYSQIRKNIEVDLKDNISDDVNHIIEVLSTFKT